MAAGRIDSPISFDPTRFADTPPAAPPAAGTPAPAVPPEPPSLPAHFALTNPRAPEGGAATTTVATALLRFEIAHFRASGGAGSRAEVDAAAKGALATIASTAGAPGQVSQQIAATIRSMRPEAMYHLLHAADAAADRLGRAAAEFITAAARWFEARAPRELMPETVRHVLNQSPPGGIAHAAIALGISRVAQKYYWSSPDTTIKVRIAYLQKAVLEATDARALEGIARRTNAAAVSVLVAGFVLPPAPGVEAWARQVDAALPAELRARFRAGFLDAQLGAITDDRIPESYQELMKEKLIHFVATQAGEKALHLGAELAKHAAVGALRTAGATVLKALPVVSKLVLVYELASAAAVTIERVARAKEIERFHAVIQLRPFPVGR